MAKKESYMIKTVSGNTNLEITAKTGESLLIKDVRIYNPYSTYVTLKIEKTTVGYFRVGGNLGNHLSLPIGSALHSHGLNVGTGGTSSAVKKYEVIDAFGAGSEKYLIGESGAFGDISNAVTFGSIPLLPYDSILSYLWKNGIFKGYPVAEGETFQISGAAKSGAIQMIVYEKYDAGDIKSDMENGSASKSYFYINYGTVSDEISTTGDTQYTVSNCPAEFPDFPFGKTVPAKTKITLYGILASDIVDDRGSNDSMNSEYLKLIKERVVLFDENRNGLLLKGITGTTDTSAQIARGVSILGNFSDIDLKPPFMLPEPLVFGDGDELNVYLTTTAGSGQDASDLAVADVEVGFIQKVERAE